MANESRSRVRYGEAFWRAHHDAWRQSVLNQREYCEAHGINPTYADAILDRIVHNAHRINLTCVPAPARQVFKQT